MNGATSDWTPAMIATVRQHWGDKTAREIGDMIGKPRNAVLGKADRLGLKRLATTPEAIWRTQEAVTTRIVALHARMVGSD